MSARPRILLAGGTGQVGWELRRTLAPLGEVIAPPRSELDLGRPATVRARIRELRPELIVNAAAYTAVDRAEEERDAAFAVNSHGPLVMAEEAARLGAAVVHYSTDYVFDGAKAAPYAEDDPTGPLGVYGESKLEGERAVREGGGTAWILRTSWVYGLRGGNFLRTMLRLARERDELRVVADQTGAPTWSRMIAEATATLLALHLDRARSGGGAPPGTYHLTAAGSTSWYEFARAILELDPAPEQHRCRSVVPIPTSEYPTPARRPACSTLDNGKVRQAFGLHLPDWREQLQMVFDRLPAPDRPPLPGS